MKLISFLNQVSKGAKQVKFKYSNFGMMCVCLPQDIYYQVTQENVTMPIVLPLVPPFNERQGQVTWQKSKELHDQQNITNKALIKIAKSELDKNYHPTLTQLFTGLPDCNFLDLFNCVWMK